MPKLTLKRRKFSSDILAMKRSLMGFSLQALAQRLTAGKLKVTPSAILKWEHGKCQPNVKYIPRLAKVLNVPVEALYQNEANSPKSVN